MYPIDGEANITKDQNLLIFKIGDEVTLKCTITNVNKTIKKDLKYQWFRKGSDGAELMLEETGKVVKLSPLTLSNKGKYKCVITCDKLGEWKMKSKLVVNAKCELSICSNANILISLYTRVMPKKSSK